MALKVTYKSSLQEYYMHLFVNGLRVTRKWELPETLVFTMFKGLGKYEKRRSDQGERPLSCIDLLLPTLFWQWLSVVCNESATCLRKRETSLADSLLQPALLQLEDISRSAVLPDIFYDCPYPMKHQQMVEIIGGTSILSLKCDFDRVQMFSTFNKFQIFRSFARSSS